MKHLPNNAYALSAMQFQSYKLFRDEKSLGILRNAAKNLVLYEELLVVE